MTEENSTVKNALDKLEGLSLQRSGIYSPGELGDSIIIGDCLEEMRKMPEKSVNLCITDPPWGIDFNSFREKFNDEKIMNDELEAYRRLMNDFPDELHRILKPDGSAYIFCGATSMLTKDGKALHWAPWDAARRFWNAGFIPRRILIWDKMAIGRGKQYRNQIEFIIFFTKKKTKFRGEGEFRNEYILCPDGLEVNHQIRVHGSKKGHPAEKPVRLYCSFILDTTDPGDLVIDPFAGSGPLIEACKSVGRKYLAIEKNADYEKQLRKRESQCTLMEFSSKKVHNQMSLIGDEEEEEEQTEQVDSDPGLLVNSLSDFLNDDDVPEVNLEDKPENNECMEDDPDDYPEPEEDEYDDDLPF